MKNSSKKEGFALLFVMLILSFTVIAASALFKYGETARIRYSGNADETQAFWLAEAGIAEIQAMTAVLPRPFGWGALPDTDTPLVRNDFEKGWYSVVIKENSAGRNLYTITSTGVCNGYTNVVVSTAELENFNKAAFTTNNKSKNNIFLTSMDRIIGPMYMNGQICLMEYQGHPFLEFLGVVNSTADSVYLDYASGKDGPVAYAPGAVDSIFTEGIYLNSPELDFTGDNSSDYVNDIRDVAGLTLNGNHDIKLLPSGDMIITPSNGNSYTSSVSSINNGTVYVTGKLTISGTLNGELTIGVVNGVTIGDDGIRYESAPPGDNPELWSSGDIANIDDVFGLITKKDVVCEGTDPIVLQGAYMSTGGSVYPAKRNTVCPGVDGKKPTMYLFGSLAEAVFGYTEGSEQEGFGTLWMYDPRFDGIAIKNFANRSYKFSGW